MRDVLATHRDLGPLGLRHKTWAMVLLGIVALQIVLYWGLASPPHDVVVQVNGQIVRTDRRRVAVVMPLHTDQTALLEKRFKAWNGKRFPCLEGAGAKPDIVFYMDDNGASANKRVISEQFERTPARHCFGLVRYLSAPPLPSDSKEVPEAYGFYRLFDAGSEVRVAYDVIFYMSPFVWQVKKGWADKIYAEAILSDKFWIMGSAAMATCPQKALTPDGDCDGSITLAFPAVVHINVNALYDTTDPEFHALLRRAEKRYPGVGPDVAIFQELVSTDHPITSKMKRGGQRKHLPDHHDSAISNARHRNQPTHVTSLYWPAHIHRYRYSDFIVNALAGKKHFKSDLQKGLHPNTFLVHQGLEE